MAASKFWQQVNRVEAYFSTLKKRELDDEVQSIKKFEDAVHNVWGKVLRRVEDRDMSDFLKQAPENPRKTVEIVIESSNGKGGEKIKKVMYNYQIINDLIDAISELKSMKGSMGLFAYEIKKEDILKIHKASNQDDIDNARMLFYKSLYEIADMLFAINEGLGKMHFPLLFLADDGTKPLPAPPPLQQTAPPVVGGAALKAAEEGKNAA
jgi:D-mannonate dehydratase